jgi:hypothetical protein
MGDTSQQLVINAQLAHLNSIIPLLGTRKRRSDSFSLGEAFILSLKIDDVARAILGFVLCKQDFAVVDFEKSGTYAHLNLFTAVLPEDTVTDAVEAHHPVAGHDPAVMAAAPALQS